MFLPEWVCCIIPHLQDKREIEKEKKMLPSTSENSFQIDKFMFEQKIKLKHLKN